MISEGVADYIRQNEEHHTATDSRVTKLERLTDVHEVKIGTSAAAIEEMRSMFRKIMVGIFLLVAGGGVSLLGWLVKSIYQGHP